MERLLLPGELEWGIEQDRRANGIPLSEATVAMLNQCADQFGAAHLE